MTGNLGGLVKAFQAAKLFWPQRAVEIGPTAAVLDTLRVFPFTIPVLIPHSPLTQEEPVPASTEKR